MKDRNTLGNEEIKELNEGTLKEVSGSGEYHRTNSSTYKSGDTPRYKAGDKVQVLYYPGRTDGGSYYVDFTVDKVSETKDGGIVCKEFTYELVSSSDGTRLTGVFESCMSPNRK